MVDGERFRNGKVMTRKRKGNGMISIIVPVYNVEKYLKRCIDSIIGQTCRDLEIILIDDGSTDACPQICDEYEKKDSRIKVVHRKNGGLSEARNTGLDMATGEYVGFVDSDDYILPEMYEILHQACEENHVAIAVCGRRIVDENDRVIKYEFCEEGPSILSAKEALRSFLTMERWDSAAWDKLYRRELFAEIRYPAGVYYEDQNVTARLVDRAGAFYHVGQALYSYRKRRGSITSLSFNQHSMDEVKQAELLKEFVDANYLDLKQESLHFVLLKMSYVLFMAYQCCERGMKKCMKEAAAYGLYYFPYVMKSRRLSVKHKIWYCRNYCVLKWKLWIWGKSSYGRRRDRQTGPMI